MKMLIPIDGSAFTKKMLAYLTTHEELLAGAKQVTLLNVQSALPPRVRSALGQDVVADHYRDASAKVTAPVVKFFARHGVDALVVSKVGQPGETIGKLADSGRYDLVVMGSHGQGALLSLVLGSVATQVLAKCSVPVLIVR